MKDINVDTIFEVFNQGDEIIYRNAGLEHVMDEDVILLNTAIRGIENYWKLDEIFSNKQGERYEDIRMQVKVKYFNKMYGYLKKVGMRKLEPFFDTVGDLGYGTVENSLKEYLDHFIEVEEYEKCVIIHKLLNVVRKLYYPEMELV